MWLKKKKTQKGFAGNPLNLRSPNNMFVMTTRPEDLKTHPQRARVFRCRYILFIHIYIYIYIIPRAKELETKIYVKIYISWSQSCRRGENLSERNGQGAMRLALSFRTSGQPPSVICKTACQSSPIVWIYITRCRWFFAPEFKLYYNIAQTIKVESNNIKSFFLPICSYIVT